MLQQNQKRPVSHFIYKKTNHPPPPPPYFFFPRDMTPFLLLSPSPLLPLLVQVGNCRWIRCNTSSTKRVSASLCGPRCWESIALKKSESQGRRSEHGWNRRNERERDVTNRNEVCNLFFFFFWLRSSLANEWKKWIRIRISRKTLYCIFSRVVPIDSSKESSNWWRKKLQNSKLKWIIRYALLTKPRNVCS